MPSQSSNYFPQCLFFCPLKTRVQRKPPFLKTQKPLTICFYSHCLTFFWEPIEFSSSVIAYFSSKLSILFFFMFSISLLNLTYFSCIALLSLMVYLCPLVVLWSSWEQLYWMICQLIFYLCLCGTGYWRFQYSFNGVMLLSLSDCYSLM